MYQWVRPQIALPVHGEARHMVEHAALARGCQVPETVVAPNGTLVRLAPGPAEIIDQVHAGRLARDGDSVVPLDGEALQRAAQAPVERRGRGDPGDRRQGRADGRARSSACAASRTATAAWPRPSWRA